MNKFFKIAILVLGAIVILLVVAALLAQQMINERLPDLLGDNIHIEEADIDIIGRGIHVYHPEFKGDSLLNNSEMKLMAEASSIYIEGFSYWNILFEEEISVSLLGIDSLYAELDVPKNLSSPEEKKDINLFVRDIFTRIKVDKFELNSAAVEVLNSESGDRLYVLKNLNLSAGNVVVDTATVEEVFPLKFDRSDLFISHIYMKAGSEYTLEVDSLMVSDTVLTTRGLQLKSIYSKEEFVNAQPYEKARLDIELDGVVAQHLLWNVDSNKQLSITSPKTSLLRPTLNVFKDKSPPREPIEVKPLLNKLLTQIPVIFTIDTLIWEDGYVGYEQRPVAYPRSGVIFFDHFYVSGYNVTNDSVIIAKSPEITLDVATGFMGQGDLKVTIKLDMSSTDQAFQVSGELGKLPLSYVNQVLLPLAGTEATGQVEQLVFNFEGDNYDANGEMSFSYQDLEITMVDEEKDKEWFKSMLGNLVLRNNNMPADGDYKEGKIYFVRYLNKDFFHFLWNAVRTGLMDTAVPFYSNPDEDRSPNDPKYLIEDENT